MIERLDLDVLRYETLVAEAHALLPALCPDWTDHNPSDLGITLIELRLADGDVELSPQSSSGEELPRLSQPP